MILTLLKLGYQLLRNTKHEAIMVAFTNFSAVGRSGYFRILPIKYRLKFIDINPFATWSLRLHVESKITIRFLGCSSLGLIYGSPILIEICKGWLVLGRDVITNSSVSSSLSFNEFNFIHALILSTRFSSWEILISGWRFGGCTC